MRANEYAGRPACIALVRDWSRGFRVWRVDVHDFADAAVDAGHDARNEHFVGTAGDAGHHLHPYTMGTPFRFLEDYL